MNLPKIKPEQFENDFFSIKGTPQLNTSLVFFDFQYVSTPIGLNGMSILINQMPSISPNVFQKNIQLKQLVFNNTLNMSDIKNHLDKEFIKIMSDLGEKHRETAPKNFDININDMRRKGMSPDRGIIAKLNNVSNYIAVEGRIGPAQFIVSSIKTYQYILKYIGGMNYLFKGNDLWIGNMPYKIDNSVEDDIILLGRKNQIDQPGVHCLILTDDDGYISFQPIVDPNFNTKVILHYNIVDVGFHPQYQFFKINTRDITYYRNLKLQKIKEIYGN